MCLTKWISGNDALPDTGWFRGRLARLLGMAFARVGISKKSESGRRALAVLSYVPACRVPLFSAARSRALRARGFARTSPSLGRTTLRVKTTASPEPFQT